MLWHKTWVETRSRFLIGLGILTLLAMGAVFGYPAVARQLLPLATTIPDDGSLVSRAIRQSLELSRTFRGYVWQNAFSQNFPQMGVLFAVLLGTGGLRSDAIGTLFTLSLPASRRQILNTRALTGLAELLAIALVPSLALAMLAPAIGERFSVIAALVHGVCLFAGIAVFFSLTFWLSTLFSDIWRPGLIACVVAVAIAFCETALDRTFPHGLYHLIRADSYFFAGRIPWVELLVAPLFSVAMIYAAIVSIEERDF